MTRIDVAPDLVEEATFLIYSRAADRGDPRALAWLEGRERLYEIADAEQREREFRAYSLAAFRKLHCDEPLRLALEALPAATRRLDALFVRRARRRNEEIAELYCADQEPHSARATRAVLALRPERFEALESLYDFVRRELLFVDDMLDEGFAYAPAAIDQLLLDPGQADVVRERVQRAWQQRIETRARGEVVTGRFMELVEQAAGTLRVPQQGGADRPR